MTRRAVALAPQAWQALHRGLTADLETAWICTGHEVVDDGFFTFLVTDATPVTSYVARTPTGMSIASEAWVPLVRRAAAEGRRVAFAHSHPGGAAVFSERDDGVDAALSPAILQLNGQPAAVSIIVAGNADQPTMAARFIDPDGATHDADIVRAVGHRLMIWPAGSAVTDTDIHDRQIRALGPDGQRSLAALRVGVAGLGGHGSEASIKLVQLGVGQLVGVDDDIVSPSTPTRGSGYRHSDVGDPKAAVLAEWLGAIRFPTQIELHELDLTTEAGLRTLIHCDVIVGALDVHTPRRYLNRLAYQYLVPFMDLGVLVTDDRDHIEVFNRITWVAPGTACLECRSRIDDGAVLAEGLDPDERRRRAGEGYIPDIDTPAPSVVAYTTLTVGVALTELLARIFGFTNVEHGETLVHGHANAIRRLAGTPTPGCLCATPSDWGRPQKRFLGLLIPAA